MMVFIKRMAPAFVVGAVAIIFGFGAYFFIQAYSDFKGEKKKFETMQTRVRLATVQKNELISKQRILEQTVRFINKAKSLKLLPAKWTVYDVNLQEAVSFDKADQIINQCSHSQVAYFQPLTLQLKATPKQAQATNNSEAGEPGDLTLIVQGKFVARQP